MALVRTLAVVGGLAWVLAACQPLPVQPTQGARTTQGAQLAKASPPGQANQAIQRDREALDVRIFLASESPTPGWVPVNLNPQGVLYVRTEPVITRRDLIGIQSAVDDQSGEGILVIAMSDAGFNKIRAATSAHPGLRLALVVGKTMLAAPGYAAPVSEKQLAFRVGTRENADKAARAVAGVLDPAASGL